MHDPALAQAILDAFDRLFLSLQQLSEQLLQDPAPCWLPTETASPKQAAAALYTDIWYQHHGDGRETRSLHGLVAAAEATIRQAEQVNRCKAAFQQVIQAYRAGHGERLPEQLHQRSQQLASTLQHQGLARLHLKQCYRQIPILDRCPSKVGFNWYCSGRSIRTLSIGEAEQMLLELDCAQPHVQRQLEALGRLQPGERLAQVQQLAPVMRANIVWKEARGVTRKARNCALPLLFPYQPGQPFPQHNRPAPTPPPQRRRIVRSDNQLDPVVFLPSLRIHRYL